jgi:hypothetical protein
VWEPNLNGDDLTEVEIYGDCDRNNRINRDGYDSFGEGYVNGDVFDWDLTEDEFVDDELVGREIVVPGSEIDDTAGSTYTISFSNNNVTYLINSTSPTAQLRITGNLGSDGRTIYTTLGSHFISYEKNNDTGLPNDDPIFLWESNGTYTRDTYDDPVPPPIENGRDSVRVSTTGNMLQLRQYAYAFRVAGFTSSREFFNLFLKFIEENKNRTDVFTVDWRPVTAPPVEVSVRKSTNLQFNEALYGSDKLSDPDGELRKTIDSINAKYGNLIK